MIDGRSCKLRQRQSKFIFPPCTTVPVSTNNVKNQPFSMQVFKIIRCVRRFVQGNFLVLFPCYFQCEFLERSIGFPGLY
jgi:hypothetical protein